MQTVNFVKEYKDDNFIHTFMNLSFDNVLETKNEMVELLSYIKEHSILLVEKTGWKNFFYPFKKIVKTLSFLNNWIHVSKEFSNNYQGRRFLEWKSIEDIINTLLEHCNHDIYSRKFKALYRIEKNTKRKAILNIWLLNFFNSNLSSEKKIIYNKLNKKLSEKIKQFKKNGEKALWKQRGAIYIPTHQKFILKGVEQNILDVGSHNAKKAQKEGWLFYADEGTITLLIAQAKNRSFRKKIFNAHQKLNSAKRVRDNNDSVLRDIISTKQMIANIFNKKNYADLVLSSYILNSPEKAYFYLDEIEQELQPLIAPLEMEIIQRACEDGIMDLKNWDIPYYVNLIEQKWLQQKENNIDDYFIFNNVLLKFIKYLEKEFNLSFILIRKETINNEELLTYHVIDNVTKHESYFMISPFYNKSKESNSQTELCSNEKIKYTKYQPSVQYITYLMEKNTTGSQKMNFQEMIIFLHEFGHALHAFYAPKEDSYLNESTISWDLIELPSQFMEHMAYDFEFMKNLSSHYETKKKINKRLLKLAIEKEQALKHFEIYKEVKKYYAQLWLHENFKKYSRKSPQEIVNEIIGDNGLIYNITHDSYMLYNNHLTDYAPSGYIYLYSGQIAQNLIGRYKPEIKKVFTNLFNSAKINKMETRLNKIIDLNEINMEKFFKKGWNINLYGSD